MTITFAGTIFKQIYKTILRSLGWSSYQHRGGAHHMDRVMTLQDLWVVEGWNLVKTHMDNVTYPALLQDTILFGFPSENCIAKDGKASCKYRNIFPATHRVFLKCRKSLSAPGGRPCTFSRSGKTFRSLDWDLLLPPFRTSLVPGEWPVFT